MIPEEVVDFYLGIGLAVVAALRPRIVLPIEHEFFSAAGRKLSIYRARDNSA